MILDGKQVAEKVFASLEARRKGIDRSITLGIAVCGGDATTESFVRMKERVAERLNVHVRRVPVSPSATTEDMIFAVRALSDGTDTVVVQLPLPGRITSEDILSAIPKEKDVDALNPRISFDERTVHAPVAEAVDELLRAAGVSPEGKRAVVIGEGRLVGRPVADMLRAKGADVSVVTLTSGSLEKLKDADIVVSGAGFPSLIQPQMIKEGVVLIDAGTSEMNGAVVGDADPACADVASVFTPVPGGVGPVMIAKLFENVLALAEHEARGDAIA